jgi:hypothetical protein
MHDALLLDFSVRRADEPRRIVAVAQALTSAGGASPNVGDAIGVMPNLGVRGVPSVTRPHDCAPAATLHDVRSVALPAPKSRAAM